MTQIQKYFRNSFRSLLSSKNRNKPDFKSKLENANQDVSENRYSVLYLLNGHYHHVGCSSQEEAQSVQGSLMTDGNRIPVGIYDAVTDAFEWEIIGQYFHSQDSASEQRERMEEVLTMARALRRRDSTWEPGVLQRPGLFA